MARCECRVIAAGPDEPVLDEDGLLRVGDRWVAIPDAQLPIVELLLSKPLKVVRYDEIIVRYRQAGGTARWAGVRSMLTRLAGRLRTVGLDLTAVRSRGVVLHPAQGFPR